MMTTCTVYLLQNVDFLHNIICFSDIRLSETLTLDSSISEFLSVCSGTFVIANQSLIIWFVLGKQATYR